MSHSPAVTAALVVVCALALSACTAPASSGPADATPASATSATTDTPALGEVAPGLPDRDVIGQGLVRDVAGRAELCLGAIAETCPPECSGIPIENWSWDGLDDAEDPTGGQPGASTEAELLAIQEQVHDRLGSAGRGSAVDRHEARRTRPTSEDAGEALRSR
ncbi:MAG: hypothetical protein QM622_05105 [Microbacterium sp.]